MDIVRAEDGFTHMPTTFIADCIGASPVPISWLDITPADPAMTQCEDCAALVLKTGLARHQQWHHEQRHPDR
ncbi:hypothetical protein ACQEU3_46910 [Spirillospora sp. CA-253888]